MTKITRILVRFRITLVSGLINKVVLVAMANKDDDTMRFSKKDGDQEYDQYEEDDKNQNQDHLGVRAELVDKVVSVARHIVF